MGEETFLNLTGGHIFFCVSSVSFNRFRYFKTKSIIAVRNKSLNDNKAWWITIIICLFRNYMWMDLSSLLSLWLLFSLMTSLSGQAFEIILMVACSLDWLLPPIWLEIFLVAIIISGRISWPVSAYGGGDSCT